MNGDKNLICKNDRTTATKTKTTTPKTMERVITSSSSVSLFKILNIKKPGVYRLIKTNNKNNKSNPTYKNTGIKLPHINLPLYFRIPSLI